MTKNYYEILGIGRDASKNEIKKVYRILAKKYHPDVNKSANSEEKFKEITEAYEVLSDPNSRRNYDITQYPEFDKYWADSRRYDKDELTGDEIIRMVFDSFLMRSSKRIRPIFGRDIVFKVRLGPLRGKFGFRFL